LKMLNLADTAGGLRGMVRLDAVSRTPIPRLLASPDSEPLQGVAGARLAQSDGLRALHAALIAMPDLDEDGQLLPALAEARAGDNLHVGDLARRAMDGMASDDTEAALAHGLMQGLQARRAAHASLLGEQIAAHGLRDAIRRLEAVVDERGKVMARYLKALRDGNELEQNRVAVAKVAKRLGREFALSDANIVASLRAGKRRQWTIESQDALVTRLKSTLADSGVVRGGFAQLPLDVLRQRGVVSDVLDLPGLPPGDAQAVRKALAVVFAALGLSHFSVSLLLARDTVLAVVDVDISALMGLARALVVAWRPAGFPLEFSVKKLMVLLEEISLASFL